MKKIINPYFVLYVVGMAIIIALCMFVSMPWPVAIILGDIGLFTVIVYGVTYTPYQESKITWHNHTSPMK